MASRCLNQVTLIGNVVRNPKAQHVRGSSKVSRFLVITNHTWRDKTTGERKKSSEKHICIAWNDLAEISEKILHKGTLVFVGGRLKTRKVSGRADEVRVIVSNLLVLNNKRNELERGNVYEGGLGDGANQQEVWGEHDRFGNDSQVPQYEQGF